MVLREIGSFRRTRLCRKMSCPVDLPWAGRGKQELTDRPHWPNGSVVATMLAIEVPADIPHFPFSGLTKHASGTVAVHSELMEGRRVGPGEAGSLSLVPEFFAVVTLPYQYGAMSPTMLHQTLCVKARATPAFRGPILGISN